MDAIDPVLTAEQAVSVGRPTSLLQVEGAQDTEVSIIWPTGSRLYLNMTCVLAAQVLLGLDLTIVAVCVPSLTDQFSTVNDIGWYSAAYAIAICSSNFFFGKVCKLFEVKKVLLSSLIIFEIGSLLCTIAPTSLTFICGRAIAGVGNGGISGGCNLIVVNSFPNHKRPLVNGLVNATFTFAMVSAPLLGGALIDAWTWRLCFGVSLPLGAIVFIVLLYSFQNPAQGADFTLPFRTKIRRIDIYGTALMVAAISTFLIALQWGGTKHSWYSITIISMFVTSFILFTCFGYLQHRLREEGILPLKYLKNRTVLASMWFSFCVSGTLTVVEQYLSIYFQGVKGYTASKAGIMGLPLMVGLAIGGSLSGVAVSRVGYYSLPMYATTVLSPIAAGLLSKLNIDQNNVRVLACLGLLGFAFGIGSCSPVSAIQTILEPIEVPSGLAVASVGGTMGAAISICISAALFQSRLVHDVRNQDPSIDTPWLWHSGLTNIRHNITSDRLNAVLRGYDQAIDQTLYLPVALTILTLIGSATIGWRSVKEKHA